MYMPAALRHFRLMLTLLTIATLVLTWFPGSITAQNAPDSRGFGASPNQADFVRRWVATLGDETRSVAWGDADGDGDLDLAVGNIPSPLGIFDGNNYVYLNDGSLLDTIPVWGTAETDSTNEFIWGDYDNDGDLDLFAANGGDVLSLFGNGGTLSSNPQPNRLYRNDSDGDTVTFSLVWSSAEVDDTTSAAWGDYDLDGDLDLFVGNYDGPNRLYLNEFDAGGDLTLIWSSSLSLATTSVAWGDMDNDGLLDIVAGQFSDALVAYRNTLIDSQFEPLTDLAWASSEPQRTLDIALGDLNGDDLLDIAVATSDENVVYGNNFQFYATIDLGLEEVLPEFEISPSVELGDIDSDGDLDLLFSNIRYDAQAGEFAGRPVRAIRNDLNLGGTLASYWSSSDTNITADIALADADGDGDLDFVAGNGSSTLGNLAATNRLFLNDSTPMEPQPAWQSIPEDGTVRLTWGDVDNDGDLDLATTSDTIGAYLYENLDGELSLTPAWQPDPTLAGYIGTTVAWADIEGDGDLDLLVASFRPLNTLIFTNNNGTLDTLPSQILPDGGAVGAAAWVDYDNDGDLDLLTAGNDLLDGDNGVPSRLYRNTNGVLETTPVWQSEPELLSGANDTDPSYDQLLAAAWGDADNDGDLDLAVGGYLSTRVYRNDNGNLTTTSVWSKTEQENTFDLAWADVDGDGNMDLVVANAGTPNRVYRNEFASTGSFVAGWASDEYDETFGIDLADFDGDRDLDLATGNNGTSRIYRNDYATGGTYTLIWSAPRQESTNAIAWGDVDNDGDYDLAFGNAGDADRLLLNRRSNGAPQSPMPSVELAQPMQQPRSETFAVPVILSDGIIPITYTLSEQLGERVRFVRGLYSLDGGGTWQAATPTTGTITSDLPTSRQAFEENRQTIPDNGTLNTTLTLGGNGVVQDLEVALLLDHSTSRQLSASISAPWPPGETTTVMLFDNLTQDSPRRFGVQFYDDADQQILTPRIRSYISTDVPIEISEDITSTIVSTLDIPDPGTIVDVNVTNLAGEHSWLSDLTFTLFSPQGTPVTLLDGVCSDNEDFFLSFDDEARFGSFPCPPTDGLRYPAKQLLDAFDGEEQQGTWTLVVTDSFALDGGNLQGWGLEIETVGATRRSIAGGDYRPEQSLAAFNGMPLDTPLTLTITDDTVLVEGILESWGLYVGSIDHVYGWDVFGSNFFGQYDNALFRIEAYPELHYTTDGLPGFVPEPYHYPYTAAETAPFRLRGSQVRVVDEQGKPQVGAYVYRLPAEQTSNGDPLSSATGELFTTDSQGFLQGRGNLAVGDQLYAIAPQVISDTYVLYHTNGTPTQIGLDVATYSTAGVQELVVSADKPLILFDLIMALEWDASKDEAYLDELTANIERAAGYLFDFTNGQVSLGNVYITQNADAWNLANVVVRAANNVRPWAIQGGIVVTPTLDPQINDIRYDAGQISMGTTWNRYGNPGQSLGNDWAIILAHELSHYTLFLDDVYLGIDENGFLKSLDSCVGSAMGDLYTDPQNTEFIFDDAFWQANCGETLTNRTLQRNEWETIKLWYPELNIPTAINAGPDVLPFNLTTISIDPPITPTNVLEDPTFYLDYVGNLQASNQAQAYIIRDNFVVPLGSPFGGQNRVRAHGAAPGDRLCAFDRAYSQLGCEVVQRGDNRVEMRINEDWRPVIQITPVTSTTINIQVSQVPTGQSIYARLFPEYGDGFAPLQLNEAEPGIYSGTLLLDYPALAGHIHIYDQAGDAGTAPTTRNEALVAYSIGGNPGASRGAGGASRGAGGASRGAGGASRGAGGASRGAGGASRGAGGASRGAGAPIVSPDGQMIFFTENPIIFEEGDFFTVQSMADLPNIPPGRAVIGSGYNLVSSPGAPLLQGSISFQYLGNEVLVSGASENALTVYFWNGSTWEMLPTVRDTYYNFVSAPSRGAGIYALMVSTEVPLYQPGWNNIAYPIQGTAPVTEALLSIDGAYTRVYGYDVRDQDDPWKLYDVALAEQGIDYVNDLTELTFGQGYWISATEAITLYLTPNTSINTANDADLATVNLPQPPATYYGVVHAAGGFVPQAGMAVEAQIDGAVCGRSTTRAVDGEIVYAVDVLADDGAAYTGCGAPGKQVTFVIAGTPMITTATWRNGGSIALAQRSELFRGYLPLIVRR